MSALSAHYATTRTKDEHITIEWENLHYSVLTKDSKKSTAYKSAIKNNRILKNVCGRAESGQLLAIMGPTGTDFDSIHRFVVSYRYHSRYQFCNSICNWLKMTTLVPRVRQNITVELLGCKNA